MKKRIRKPDGRNVTKLLARGASAKHSQH